MGGLLGLARCGALFGDSDCLETIWHVWSKYPLVSTGGAVSGLPGALLTLPPSPPHSFLLFFFFLFLFILLFLFTFHFSFLLFVEESANLRILQPRLLYPG